MSESKKKFKKTSKKVVEERVIKPGVFAFKNNLIYVSYIVSIVLFFFIVTGILVYGPRVTELTEGKLIFAANSLVEQPKLISEVKGVEVKRLETEIEDLGTLPPQFSAGAVLAEDLVTGRILYQKNGDQRMSPASTTKIMTALVSVEHFQPADVLTVMPEDMVGGSTMGLVVGEKLTYRGLLYGMLLNSGNDAAYTIASNYPGGLKGFVIAMNQKVAELELANTHFENPAGFDGPNHYSSAIDLARIAQEVVKNPTLSRVVSTSDSLVASIDNTHTHSLKNINQLLGKDGIIGVKTGYTEKAGENLVGLVDRENHKVLTVILNSQARFEETKNLMDWVYRNFTWKVQ